MKQMKQLSACALFLMATVLPLMSMGRNNSTGPGPLENLRVETRLGFSRTDGYFIHFIVSNSGATPITVFEDWMPWNTRSAFTIVALQLKKGGAVYQAIKLIEDPRTAHLTIPAGAHVAGNVVLAGCFDDWKGILKKGGEIAVFWSLKVIDSSMAHQRRFSDFIEIPPAR